MSLYNKTKEEIAYYLENRLKTNEFKQTIINEYIDGEILFELEEKDLKALGFKNFHMAYIKYDVNNQKKLIKENKYSKKDEIIKKLSKFGIDSPDKFINSNIDELNLNIGKKILLKKYINCINSSEIDIKSSKKEVLYYLKNKLEISNETLNILEGLNRKYLFKMKLEEFDIFDIKIEDKNKLKNLFNKIKENNKDKETKNLIKQKNEKEIDEYDIEKK